jgi:hypothetical protein
MKIPTQQKLMDSVSSFFSFFLPFFISANVYRHECVPSLFANQERKTNVLPGVM